MFRGSYILGIIFLRNLFWKQSLVHSKSHLYIWNCNWFFYQKSNWFSTACLNSNYLYRPTLELTQLWKRSLTFDFIINGCGFDSYHKNSDSDEVMTMGCCANSPLSSLCLVLGKKNNNLYKRNEALLFFYSVIEVRLHLKFSLF